MGQGWVRLTERAGGTVIALTTARTAAGGATIFAATAVGVRRSLDGGMTWATTGAGDALPFVEALAASTDFARDRTLFAGTRRGLFRSVDGGQRWELVLGGGHIHAVATASGPAGERVVLAGTAGDGLLRSEDAGHRWRGANAGLLDGTVTALALSPRFAHDGTGFAATPSGLYRTRSAGRSWRAVGLPAGEPAVQALALSPHFPDDGLALAGTEADGLLRSDDGGATWRYVPEFAGCGVAALAISSPGAGRPAIAAASDAGILISPDGGATWGDAAAPDAPALGLAFAPHGGGEVLVAGLQRLGIARSADGGRTWAAANTGLRAGLLVGLAVSPAFGADGTLFAASLDEGVLASTNRGDDWAARNDGLGGLGASGLACSPRYGHDRTLYAATAAGVFRSRDGAATWAPVGAAGVAAHPQAILAGPPAADGATPLFVVAADGRVLFSDDGAIWRAVEHPFAGLPVRSLALSPAYGRDRTLFAGAVGPAPDGHGDAAILWRSADGGAQWERWLEERGPTALPLAVPDTYPLDGTVAVGLGTRVGTPLRDAWETQSGLRRPLWRRVGVGGEGAPVVAVAASPDYRRDGTLFAATNLGVSVSRDGGQHFTRWGGDPSPAPLVALAVSPAFVRDRLVYAVELGGAIWRRADR